MDLNIFEYTDFREFLKDFYDHSKKNNDSFSYRYFARKAGFSSSNFLYLVMEGKRNLTKEFVPKFSSAMGLGKKEQQYFDALVSFNQAKDPEAKRYYLEIIYNLRKDKTGTLLTDKQYEYVSTWYYPVIRELVAVNSFKEDREWIRKQLRGKITGRQVSEAISTLIRLGLIKRDQSGKLVQTEKNVVTENEVAHIAAYKFHQQMLSLAKEVLSTSMQHEREISGITMAVSKKQFGEIKRKISEFEDEIMRYLNTDQDVPESVFQLNIQLFSVTDAKGGNGSNGGKK